MGCFISWSSLQAPLISLSAPEPFSHSKVPSTPSLSLQSSYAGDLTWEMGVEIVNRAIWLPFLGEKKTWDCNGKRKKDACSWCGWISVLHKVSRGLVWGVPEEIMSAPRRCRWRSGSGCGSLTARSALGSAAGSAAQTVVLWRRDDRALFRIYQNNSFTQRRMRHCSVFNLK